jgi:hypothetical protein
VSFCDLADDAVRTKEPQPAGDGLAREFFETKAVEGAAQIAITQAIDSKLTIGQYLTQ